MAEGDLRLSQVSGPSEPGSSTNLADVAEGAQGEDRVGRALAEHLVGDPVLASRA